MADGRLFLKCKRCGEQILVFKSFEIPGQGYIPARTLRKDDGLEAFMQDHIGAVGCIGDHRGYGIPADPLVFEFVNEGPEHYDGSVRRWEQRAEG